MAVNSWLSSSRKYIGSSAMSTRARGNCPCDAMGTTANALKPRCKAVAAQRPMLASLAMSLDTTSCKVRSAVGTGEA
ncbi:hypothetical protein D9M68_792580 [compost metagenome]